MNPSTNPKSKIWGFLKILLIGVLFTSILKTSDAAIIISEVMYDPNQCSDTACEWIELYNSGTAHVDLSAYRINNNFFEPTTINSKEFIIVARKLADSAGGESFEAFWGNNDGIWDSNDGNFRAVDGTFSLTNTNGTINLSNGQTEQILFYTSNIGGNGNGRSIVKIDLLGSDDISNWEEGLINGTPGYSENQDGNSSGSLSSSAEIKNAIPIINYATIEPDESSQEGIQITPPLSGNKTITVNASITDLNGISDITIATIEINSKTYNFSLQQISEESAYATASFNFSSEPAGFYNVTLSISDSSATISKILTFEYLPLLALEINISSIDFGEVEPSSISLATFAGIKNNGNVEADLEIFGSDLSSDEDTIFVGHIKSLFDGTESPLTYEPSLIDADIFPSTSTDMGFRLFVPVGIEDGIYQGSITIVGVESES